MMVKHDILPDIIILQRVCYEGNIYEVVLDDTDEPFPMTILYLLVFPEYIVNHLSTDFWPASQNYLRKLPTFREVKKNAESKSGAQFLNGPINSHSTEGA